MEYSVIVEGPFEGRDLTDDLASELERFLNSVGIPFKQIEKVGGGEAKVIKQGVDYEEALRISDRLNDLGVDSMIDPPTKPEADELAKATEGKALEASKIKQELKPKPQQRGATVQSTARSIAGQNAQNIRVNGKVTNINKARRATERPQLKVVASQNAASLETVTSKASQTPVQHGAQPKATSNKSSSTLNQSAAEIKSLFDLRGKGAVQITLPRATAIKTNVACLSSLLAPGAYALALLSAFGLGVFLLGLLSLLLTKASGILTALVVLPLAVSMLSVFAVLTAPFWRRPKRLDYSLLAKDEPRLFMLVTATSKVLNLPTPTAIHLDMSTEIRAKFDCSLKDFFAPNRPLKGQLQLQLGASLLHRLSVRELCAMIANEVGRFAPERFRRRQLIITAVQKWLQGARASSDLASVLSRCGQKIETQSLRQLVFTLAATVKRLLHFPDLFFGRAADAMDTRYDYFNPIGPHYLAQIVGEANVASFTKDLHQQLRNIHETQSRGLAKLLNKNANQRFVDDLPRYVDYLLSQNPSTQPNHGVQRLATTGLVKSHKAISDILDLLARHGQGVTLSFYQSRGMEAEKLDLLSFEDLFRLERNDAKAEQCAELYFGQWFNPLQFWRLPADLASIASSDDESLLARLNTCIARVRYMSPERPEALMRRERLTNQLVELEAAKKVLNVGNPFSYQHCSDVGKDLEKEMYLRASKVKELDDDLRQQNAVMGERLALGLLLAQRAGRQEKALSVKLLRSLNGLHIVGDKVHKLILHTEELRHLRRHKPKKLAAHYQLHLKELGESIEDCSKVILRRLHQCPYDFYERKYETIGMYLDGRLQNMDPVLEQDSVARAHQLLAGVARAYKNVNNIAASLASIAERKHRAETIKKITLNTEQQRTKKESRALS